MIARLKALFAPSRPTTTRPEVTQLTGEEFRHAVARDPAWASKLTGPTEITCGFSEVGVLLPRITHLSPWLHFSFKNQNGVTAHFNHCPGLKIAEGRFAGSVDFSRSGVEKIGNLQIDTPNNWGIKAKFVGCDIRLPQEFLGPEFEMDEAVRRKNLARLTFANSQKNQPGGDLEI